MKGNELGQEWGELQYEHAQLRDITCDFSCFSGTRYEEMGFSASR